MSKYPQTPERVFLGDTTTLPQQRARKAVCASTVNPYQFLQIDVCGKQSGQKPMFPISTSRDVARVFRGFIKPDSALQEYFAVMALDARNVPIALAVVHKGGLNATIADPKVFIKPVLLVPATAYIICHNHPSSDPTPSADDVELTKQAARGSTYVGLKLFDHVILGTGERYYSFLDAGKMP